MSGTITNWVSSLVELDKPFTWWNAVVLMAVVTRADSGGLTAG